MKYFLYKKIRFRYYLILILFIIGQSVEPSVFAQTKILDVNQIKESPVLLTEYFSVFEDPTALLSFTDVKSPKIANFFKTDTRFTNSFNYGYSSSAHWLRLVLHNSSNQPIEQMLEISEARLSQIQFYQPLEQGNYSTITTGMAFPFSSRPYKNRYFVFPITLPANSEQIYYLKIQSKTTKIIPAKLWSIMEFQKHERNDYVIQAWYFGMVSAMVLFNLLLFVLLRNIIYLLYVNSCLGIAVYILAVSGLFKEFLFPESSFWADKTLPYVVGVSTIFFLIFMRAMLNTQVIVPKLDKLLKILMSIYMLTVLALNTVPLQVPIKPLLVIYLLTPFLILGTSLVCVFKKQPSAYIFTVAFFMFLLGASITQIRNVGILPTNIFTINSVQIGSVCEMLLMAMALADRFNTFRKEKEQAQAALVENLRCTEQILEECVAKRTEELQIANNQLKILSATDGLTGIANRRCFDETLLEEWQRAKRHNQSLALGLVDIDWFKKYNDFYGHQMGDECLKNVANLLTKAVGRSGDLVARYGGEEFVFIAPATDKIIALHLAEKICTTLQQLALPHKMSDFGCVTASIGVAAMIPSENTSPEMLIKMADEALYYAKEHGRNQALIFECDP